MSAAGRLLSLSCRVAALAAYLFKIGGQSECFCPTCFANETGRRFLCAARGFSVVLTCETGFDVDGAGGGGVVVAFSLVG